MFVLANLTDDQLDRLRAFEQKAGIKILAMKHVDIEMAPIDATELTELQTLESELGVCLVAVR